VLGFFLEYCLFKMSLGLDFEMLFDKIQIHVFCFFNRHVDIIVCNQVFGQHFSRLNLSHFLFFVLAMCKVKSRELYFAYHKSAFEIGDSP